MASMARIDSNVVLIYQIESRGDTIMNPERLDGWKEIAAYMGKGFRDCQRKEELGLPVHRIPGTSKPRVYAYKSELDSWLAGVGAKISSLKEKPEKLFKKRLIWLALPAIAAGVFLFAFKKEIRPPKQAKSLEFLDSQITVKDRSERAVWKLPIETKGLRTPAEYQNHFIERSLSNEGVVRLPWIQIADIDGDGESELVMGIVQKDERGGDRILAYKRDQKHPVWEYAPSTKLKTKCGSFSADYRLLGFDIIPNGPNHLPRIVSIFIHFPDSPCELSVLDGQGKQVGRYFHYGHLSNILAVDLDADSVDELIVAGQNDAWEKGCLATFNLSRIRGQSPTPNDEDRFINIEDGSERDYILVPGYDSIPEKSMHETIVSLYRGSGPRISARTLESSLYFQFDYEMRVEDITVGNAFLENWIRLSGQKAARPDIARLRARVKADLIKKVVSWHKEANISGDQSEISASNGVIGSSR